MIKAILLASIGLFGLWSCRSTSSSHQTDLKAATSTASARANCLALGLWKPKNPLVWDRIRFTAHTHCPDYGDFMGTYMRDGEGWQQIEKADEYPSCQLYPEDSLPKGLCSAMVLARAIKFNIAGLIDVQDAAYIFSGISAVRPSDDTFSNGRGLRRAMAEGVTNNPTDGIITNWEFALIIQDRKLLNKTQFFINGSPVPRQKVWELVSTSPYQNP